jgi:hypothetical protein
MDSHPRRGDRVALLDQAEHRDDWHRGEVVSVAVAQSEQ